MKKKVRIFEKEISVFLIVMIGVMGIATAALVPYLSNAVSGIFDVEQPMVLELSADNSDWYSAEEDMPVSLDDIIGGEILTFYMKVTNNAEIDVESDLNITLASDYGTGLEATCGDFTHAKITATRTLSGQSADPSEVIYDDALTAICDDSTGVILITLPSQYYAGEMEHYEVELTSALNIAPSTYTLTAQEMLIV